MPPSPPRADKNDDGTSTTPTNGATAAATGKHGEPTDGMMCLCTMEDITLEDGNYVEYQSYPSLKWQPALYEKSVVEKLLNEQFHSFVERVKTTDCQAELKRLLAKGPPIYIEDEHALPLASETDTHVSKLWYACEPTVERSAKLDGALEGDERIELWTELKEFIIVEGKEEGDDDDDGDGGGDGGDTTGNDAGK